MGRLSGRNMEDTTRFNMGHCLYCGEDFVDGDSVKERSNGTVHRECELTEQAMDATWQDVITDFD